MKVVFPLGSLSIALVAETNVALLQTSTTVTLLLCKPKNAENNVQSLLITRNAHNAYYTRETIT